MDGIDKLVVYQFDFTADIPNKAYSFSAGVADVWTVPMPIIDLTIQEVTAEISYSTNELSVNLAAFWMLGPVSLMAFAERPGANNGWNLGIGTQPGDAVDILGLVQNFLGTNTEFPPFVPQTLTLTDVLFSGNTFTKNYTVKATTSAGWDLDLQTGAPNYSDYRVVRHRIDEHGRVGRTGRSPSYGGPTRWRPAGRARTPGPFRASSKSTGSRRAWFTSFSPRIRR